MMMLVDVNDPTIKLDRGDGEGPIKFLATADGYVMVRRPDGVPWVEGLGTWVVRPLETDAAPARDAYNRVFARQPEPKPYYLGKLMRTKLSGSNY